jgi:hypothetical protein
MSNVIVSKAKNTHYAVSTFAAVVYGLVWLLATRAHAEMSIEAAMPEVLVTAKRELPATDMPEVIVWGKREVAVPTPMEEIVVSAKRETTTDPRIAANTSTTHSATAKAADWMSRTRHWLRTALLK